MEEVAGTGSDLHTAKSFLQSPILLLKFLRLLPQLLTLPNPLDMMDRSSSIVQQHLIIHILDG